MLTPSMKTGTIGFVPDVNELIKGRLYKIVYSGLLVPLSVFRPYEILYMKTRDVIKVQV